MPRPMPRPDKRGLPRYIYEYDDAGSGPPVKRRIINGYLNPAQVPPLDNTGRGKVQVPGFGDVPLDYQLPCEERFTNGFEEWCQLPAITTRELTMIAVMNYITDQQDWHDKVFDDLAIAEWKAEVMSRLPAIQAAQFRSPMSELAWDWCLKELRDKATSFNQKRFVEVLDAGASVCKSDILLDESFAEVLDASLQHLITESPDAEPELVDSTFYPLIYGTTKVMVDGGATTLVCDKPEEGLFPFGPTLHTSPTQIDNRPFYAAMEGFMEYESTSQVGQIRERNLLQHDESFPPTYNTARNYYWSPDFQELPADVAFQPDGTVRFETYINNLHPKHEVVYQLLERAVSASVDMWDDCLISGGSGWLKAPNGDMEDWNQTQRGRHPLRIVTFGVEWVNKLPGWAVAFDESFPEEFQDYISSAENNTGTISPSSVPVPDASIWEKARQYLQLAEYPPNDGFGPVNFNTGWDSSLQACFTELTRRGRSRESWKHPEPGTAFTYEEWKAGRNVHLPIVPMDERAELAKTRGMPKLPTHKSYDIDLRKTYNQSGLQVIVNIRNFQPDTSVHEEDWHLQGKLNEHIVASSLYVCGMDNVAAKISFRVQAPMPADIYKNDARRECNFTWHKSPDGQLEFEHADYGDLEALSEVFGFDNPELMDADQRENMLNMQDLGEVKLMPGRLLAFPNVMESRITFERVDKDRPAYLRYITIGLVDPHYRVCSTRNVPPQRWSWREPLVNSMLWQKGLPAELSEQILREAGIEKRTYHRQQMLTESKVLQAARYYVMPRFSFEDEVS